MRRRRKCAARTLGDHALGQQRQPRAGADQGRRGQSGLPAQHQRGQGVPPHAPDEREGLAPCPIRCRPRSRSPPRACRRSRCGCASSPKTWPTRSRPGARRARIPIRARSSASRARSTRRPAPTWSRWRASSGIARPYRVEHMPGHPAADANGYVKLPNVDMLVEVADMREANRSYEANLQVDQAGARDDLHDHRHAEDLMIDPILPSRRCGDDRSALGRRRGLRQHARGHAGRRRRGRRRFRGHARADGRRTRRARSGTPRRPRSPASRARPRCSRWSKR